MLERAPKLGLKRNSRLCTGLRRQDYVLAHHMPLYVCRNRQHVGSDLFGPTFFTREETMKALLIACAGVLGAALFATPAQAQYYHGRSSAHANHSRHHDDLDHRSYHRELDHREAHRYPMTHRQHGRLHDHLDHEGYHDRLEHRSAHRNRAYSPRYYYQPRYGSFYRPRGTSFYYGRPGFSIYFGR